MTESPSPLIIAERYEVIRELGGGAFGQVLEVRDQTLGAVCALKLLSDKIVVGPWEESHLLRTLRGEYILPVLNADVTAGRRYIVTEVMSGGTVEDRIHENVGAPVKQAVRWVREACQGIARVHDHGLVHGDIKPANLFLDARDEVLVGDFGLAQRVDEQGTADAVGTPATMAPEVAAAFRYDATSTRTYTRLSDVFSLGATAYWALAGRPPYSTDADQTDKIEPDIWTVAPHVPRGLRDAINRSIAVDPSKRQQSAAQLDADLGLYASPARTWNRRRPHVGHEQCYSGTKDGRTIDVCTLTSKAGKLRIEVKHANSGRRIRSAERETPERALTTALRSTFRDCN